MRIGILGGASFWKFWNKPFQEIRQETPYGNMADLICAGKYNQHDVFTLQRHGKNYEFTLQDIPWQANAYGMFLQKIDFLIHVTACGALSKEYKPGDLVLFDQLIDFTKQRPVSLGLTTLKKVSYLDFSRPISKGLIQVAHDALSKNNIQHYVGGTMLTEEGPRYSTTAESKMYKMLGADFLNHTSCPEVYFFRELTIPVLAITMVTNCIELDGFFIKAEEISTSIVNYKDVMPNAIAAILNYLPDRVDIEEIDSRPYNVMKFDLRVSG